MKHNTLPVIVLAACSATFSLAGAQGIQQTTSLHAPITAIAIGPAQARVVINSIKSPSPINISRNVSIRKPITVVARPFTNVTVRIAADR